MVLAQALRAVCDDLERHEPTAPSLHFARGLLAAGAAVPVPQAEPVEFKVPGQEVIKATARAFGYTVHDLLSVRRPQPLVEARFAAMLALRRQGVSLPRIGGILGRDHTTVLHGIARAEEIERDKPAFAEAVKAISAGSVADVIVPPPHSDFITPARARREQRYAEIARAYKGGMSLLECENKFGACVQTIKKALKAHGIAIRTGGGRAPTGLAKIDEIMKLRAQGKSGEEIGMALGVTRERVRQIVLKCGKKEEFEDRPFKPSEIEALEAYRNGQSLDYVSEQLGVSKVTARKYLVRYGIKIRPSRKRAEGRARTEAIAGKIAARYQAGESLPEIARECGFAKPEQIYRYLAIAGVKPNRQSRFWLKQAVAS